VWGSGGRWGDGCWSPRRRLPAKVGEGRPPSSAEKVTPDAESLPTYTGNPHPCNEQGGAGLFPTSEGPVRVCNENSPHRVSMCTMTRVPCGIDHARACDHALVQAHLGPQSSG
jgi:hypothetical protein